MGKEMGMEKWYGLMDLFMKENGRIISKMVSEFCKSSTLIINFKEHSKKIIFMVMEN